MLHPWGRQLLIDEDSYRPLSYKLSIDLKRSGRLSQEDRGAFGEKSMHERVEETLIGLTMRSKGIRIDCKNSKDPTSNWKTGNRRQRVEMDVVSWFNSYFCPRKHSWIDSQFPLEKDYILKLSRMY